MLQDKKNKNTSINEQLKLDGYIDTAKKIGQKVNGNTGFKLSFADDPTIASIYVGNGLAKRYIDLIVDDMTRQWINIPEDTDGNVLNYLKKIKAKKEFKNALRASKLFGGALIFMVIEDGKLPNEPVDLNTIKSVHKLKYFSRIYICSPTALKIFYFRYRFKNDFNTVFPHIGLRVEAMVLNLLST
jgi:hypothetical protein